jgi:enoyl-CoA hydratase
MIVAHEGAVFGTPELRVGLFPMMIMALIFRNIPRKRATEMMLTGEDVSAAQALQIGFVNRVAPTEALDAEVNKLADKVASFSPAVMRLGRDSIYKSMDMGYFDALTFLRSQLTINTMLEDAAEGIMAFLSKRKPDWKGR